MTSAMTSSRPVADGIAKRFQKPLVMGIVNCTPDSFFEGSRAPSKESAVEMAMRFVEEGADILDLGGQSTRPGSKSVSVDVEFERVIPVVKELARKVKLPLSVDTDKSEVAQAALDVGATIINDTSALRGDKAMVKAALKADRVVLMHMLGTPGTMQNDPKYEDCFSEVSRFLQERLDAFLAAGGRQDQVWIDPGIGFGKTLDHNLELIGRVGELSDIAPVLLGVSRKSFLAKLRPDNGPEDRLSGSLAVASWAAMQGVKVLRVHDVLETKRAVDVLMAIGQKS